MRCYQEERGRKESITITSLPSHEPLLFWQTRHLGFPTQAHGRQQLGPRPPERRAAGRAGGLLKCPSNYGGRPCPACQGGERRGEHLPGHPSEGRWRRKQGRSSSSRAGMSSAAAPLPCAGAVTFRGQGGGGEGHKYSTARGARPRGRACAAGLAAGVRAHPASARTRTDPAHGRDF